jgi:hypothetical protein
MSFLTIYSSGRKAEQAGADCVVTRNLKDFDFEFTVETLEPQDFLSKYFPEEI